MATIMTSIGPVGARQINRNLYVGQSDLITIQAAVTAAVALGNCCVIVPAGYAGSDTIASVTGGSTSVYIADQRTPQQQNYAWNGSAYTPADFVQKQGYVTTGKPTAPAGSAAFYFDPTGTSGSGTAHIDVTAPTGLGMPSLNINGVPGDGTPFVTFARFQTSTAAPGVLLGVPEIEMPSQISLFNEGFDSWNAWIGQYYLAGRKGMTIWARAAANEIDFQGQTIGGAYDQAINLNALGGNVQLGMSVVVDAAGDVTGINNLDADAITAGTCIVDNSPVRTFANTPDGPGQGMVWPDIGIPVSQGSSWQSPSISVANVPLLNATTNTFTGTLSSNVGILTNGIPTGSAGILTVGTTGGSAFLDMWGVNASSYGGIVLRSYLGDGSSYVQPFRVDNTGSYFGSAGQGAVDPTGHALFSGLNVTGVISATKNSSAGENTGANGGLLVTWNISGAHGESNFINNNMAAAGGFSWYNAPPNATINSSTVPIMTLLNPGNLNVVGNITAASKSFNIPHPMNKEKRLVHGCLEGPEFAVYYRGEGETKDGTVTITLPAYFEAITLPEGRTVQLTELFEDDEPEFGNFMAAGRVRDGKFQVRSSTPTLKFYWEVMAVRADIKPLDVEPMQTEEANDAGTDRTGEGEDGKLSASSPHHAAAATAKPSRTKRVN